MIVLNAYITRPGSDVLADWYDGHKGKTGAKLAARYYSMWQHQRQQPISRWTNSYFHLLKECEGVGRLGITFQNVAYRHLGFFGPGLNEFTILYAATERNWVYEPIGCIPESINRMNEVKGNRAKIRAATIRTPNV